MFFRRLISGPNTGPLTRGVKASDLYTNHWHGAPVLNPGGAARFAFDTYLLAPISVIGAASPMKRHPYPIGSPPMIAERGVQIAGLPLTAGQFRTTPLSNKPQVQP